MRQLSPITREAILTGTLALLSGREFGDITTRDIAKSAAISEATIFRYFRHKVEILEAIVMDRGRQIFQDLEEILAYVQDPRERLLAICRRHAAFAARNRALLHVLQREASCERPLRCADAVRGYLGKLQGILKQGIESGAFRADLDMEMMSKAFHGVVNILLFWERVEGKGPMSEEDFMRQAERFYDMHLQSIVSPGGSR